MMPFIFSKYQGAGNDFIMVDQRHKDYALTQKQRAWLCHRRFGIGADGLILLELAEGYSFKMVYYNADGGPSTMCGNGGRCIAAFARQLGLGGKKGRFIAVDGPHEYAMDEQDRVHLRMQDVEGIDWGTDHAILDTGSPHYVHWVGSRPELQGLNVEELGREIRQRSRFQPEGINVNFVCTLSDQGLEVRTYERGVEAETMACGTGVTAAAIASVGTELGRFERKVITPGGELEVHFEKRDPQKALNVVLIGPAEKVFDGTMEVPNHL